jgi:hypothetical protein
MSGNISTTSQEGIIQKLEEKKLDLDAGTLGKFFGSSKNAPSNIAGVVIIILVVTGVACLIFPPSESDPIEIWKILAPVITLILGYLFGKQET